MILLLLLASCVAGKQSSKLKGIPVPGANKLDQVLSRFLNKSDYTDSIFEYLRGNDDARRRSGNLGAGVLDRENVLNIISDIKNSYTTQNHRRYWKVEAYHEYHDGDTPHIIETALDMMKQSIYASKFRMNDTRRFRKAYQNNVSFHIAMYYGALMEVTQKMETLYTMFKKLYEWTHFIWYLFIYEKILAANVDAHDMVDRIFYLHNKHLDSLKIQTEPGNLIPTLQPQVRHSTRRTRSRRPSTRPSTREPNTWSANQNNQGPGGGGHPGGPGGPGGQDGPHGPGGQGGPHGPGGQGDPHGSGGRVQ